MDRPRRRAGLIVFAVALCGGCGDGETPLRTHALHVNFRLISFDGLESEASATIRNRQGEAILLDGTDEVQVSLPDWQVELIPQNGEIPTYRAVIPSAPGGATHTFSILRSGRQAAPASTVDLPEDPELAGPASVARSTEDLEVSWVPGAAGRTVHLSVAGGCIERVGLDVDDSLGFHRFAAGSWAESGGDCTLVLTLRRQQAGNADPTLRGGAVLATQVRELLIESTP